MANELLIQELMASSKGDNQTFPVDLSSVELVNVYPKSINRVHDAYFFVARRDVQKHLFIVSINGETSLYDKFRGLFMQSDRGYGVGPIKRCPLDHHNAMAIRQLFDFTKPVLIGVHNSIGLGDRLGLANPAHLRVVAGTNLKPILAQQSIRELERTHREAEDVMDAATWAVFQEGYENGFGADADHVKTTHDIDRMVKAGFTMFTIDSGDHVVNKAEALSLGEITSRVQIMPWELLNDTFDKFMLRYTGNGISVADDFSIQAKEEEVLRALVKYGAVVAHIVKIDRHLKDIYPDYPHELEISVDETDSPTSPLEHFMVGNELRRLGIQLTSLAPRFVGDFEKGIDYKGDLEVFRKEFIKHLKIAERLGPYKISIHSASDKFSIYDMIGSLHQGYVHLKTAGTSYLEALRTIAVVDPDLLREILEFACSQYETEKLTYHVSADVNKVPSPKHCSSEELQELFDDDDARQVLHVTFGKVLTSRDRNGEFVFRERILGCLSENEETHYEFLVRRFRRHVAAFGERCLVI
jgi:hypothetical protein